jgi:hypothetical protein
VPLVAVTGTVVSNIVTFPIHQGGGACVDAPSGLTGNQVAPPGGDTLKGGLVSLVQTNTPRNNGTREITNSANAAFQKYSGLYRTGNTAVSPGGCVAGPVIAGPLPTLTGLDAGTISLTGPNGLAVTLASQAGLKGAFFALLAAGAIPASGGAFTFTGTGGADVGPFSATINLSNPLLVWTNQGAAATVRRSQGLAVTWTGGNPGSYVYITGSAVSGTQASGFTCMAAVEAGQFTVPPYILLALPSGRGGVGVQNSFWTPLPASGLDVGLALGDVSFTADSTYTD